MCFKWTFGEKDITLGGSDPSTSSKRLLNIKGSRIWWRRCIIITFFSVSSQSSSTLSEAPSFWNGNGLSVELQLFGHQVVAGACKLEAVEHVSYNEKRIASAVRYWAEWCYNGCEDDYYGILGISSIPANWANVKDEDEEDESKPPEDLSRFS